MNIPSINNIEIPAEVFQAAATFCSTLEYKREQQHIQVKHNLGHLEIWATDQRRIFRYRRPCEHFSEFYVKGEDIKALKLGRNPAPFKFSVAQQVMENERTTVKTHYWPELRSGEHGFRFPDCNAVWNEAAMFWAWQFDIAQTSKVFKAMLPMAGESEIFTLNWADGRIEVDNNDFEVQMAGRANIPGNYPNTTPTLMIGGRLFREVIQAMGKATGFSVLRMSMYENNGIRKGLIFEDLSSGDSEVSTKAMLMPVLPLEDRL